MMDKFIESCSYGDISFENLVYKGITLDDINLDMVQEYCDLIKYNGTSEEYIIKDNITVASILLFGKDPQKYLPHACIRFIKYKDNDVVDSKVFNGTI